MKQVIPQYKTRGDFAHEMIDKYFKSSPNKTVSDIGAGFGFMGEKIKNSGGDWQPFDYVRKIEESIIWDLNCSEPENVKKAGMVIFLEVLEHLANPLLAIQNISDHIEKGGFLVLTTPNPQSSKNRINLMVKGTLYAFQEKHLQEHHVFTPWEHIVKMFLEQTGFEILEYAIVDTAYQGEKPKTVKAYLKKVIERSIEKYNPKSVGMSYGIVAKKSK
ncbi:bifunctional 2-polyprenyl-6-hydroxyphenol methylase/3-demethylubiquinol 3-O-methyltransferase UbiG [Flavobacterium sp. H122]|uniref:class I SAM-dependent methyltransferase n=1 Tax=Flavobacterium sp. H122 TaxID=2529860 RepID=UPI00145BD973|nr:methyltransferase domain-containing protein [Flavobacterium sp. H122]